MRLLFVHDRYGAFAGAEANAHITATELGRRGHTLGILHGPHTGRDAEVWNQTFTHRFPFPQPPPNPIPTPPPRSPLSSASTTRQALHDFQPDLVYVHKMADLDVLQTLVDHAIPLVRMVHDHDIYCLRSYKYNTLTRRICSRPASLHCVFPCLASVVRNHGPGLPVRWASYTAKKREISLNRRFHRMIVVTPFMRDELLRNGFDPGRIEIHAPVPRPASTPVATNRPSTPRNLIVFAGQIIRGKGVDVLLRALARVQSPFECVILGDGNHRATCEALARRLGIDDRVTFKGFVPKPEVDAHLHEASLVVIPSVWPEPIATVGLEVMRLGLPIVAFDAGGIRDWLTDGLNGFLVPWMDHRTFAKRIDQLLSDKPLARRLGQNGLALVNDRYDFQRYIAALEDLFVRTARESPSPRFSDRPNP